MIKIILIGLGKTGQYIAKEILAKNSMKIAAAVCSPSSSKKGEDLGDFLGVPKLGIKISSSDELQKTIFETKPDVAIDFSNHNATIKNAEVLSQMKVNLVIGTTGFSASDINSLKQMAFKFNNGIVYAPNITLGVNVMMLLSNIAATILNSYDFQITETHYKNKKDSPSGTALKLYGEIQNGLEAAGIDDKEIPINAVRAGGVVGKHELLIAGEYDKIEISHESFSRKVFAVGALTAASYIYKKSGYYEMKNVLDLKKILYNYIDNLDSALG